MEQQDIRQQIKQNAIMDILNEPSTYNKVMKFQSYKSILGDCKIYLFDEEMSNIDDSFKNYKIGKCGIYGVSDYTKTWIIDSYHGTESRYVEIGKTIDFDLNVFTYLNKIIQGKRINDGINRLDVIEYFNYIKKNEFQCGITTALMERATKPIDLNILSEMLISFVRFDNMNYIDDNCGEINLCENDYARVKRMYDMEIGLINEKYGQFDLLCCCVMKAFLIKEKEKSISADKKIEMLIMYCLYDLSCFIEKELILLALYIMDDEKVKETFQKLNKISKIEENILNVTWDLYHIRLIEQIFLHDNMNKIERNIFSYYATADKGLTDAMNMNPLKAFVILDDYPIPFHSVGVEDICQNGDILLEIRSNVLFRKEKIKGIDFSEKKKNLQSEIHEFKIKRMN
ncbi:hypothetical protein E4V42_03755 [Clostridium estertheticum]|uniref:Uncharacterized protein n=1 Tax=Clostridium estertheticum TaxID=238834 RepID=A0A5N7IXM1_9CLOT|nr:hypothetical protein [Clostridium estertheticum]MPQ30552.1 hypothetical protein [Clostridium estertheticum]MPQ61228.1 hypothetical protein [Clostridium estertheticum]